MLKRHAHIIFVLSILLLALVTLDFAKIAGQSKIKQPAKAKTDLVAKVDQIGKVLSAGVYFYQIKLKDSVSASVIGGGNVSVANQSSFQGSNICTLGDGVTESSIFYPSSDHYELVCGANVAMTLTISKDGYTTKSATIYSGSENIETVYLEKVKISPPLPPPTVIKKTTSGKTTEVKVETVKDIPLPKEFKGPQAETTDLSQVPDVSKISELKLGSSLNTIHFKVSIDLSASDTKDKFKELDKYVKVEEIGVVSIDSTSLPVLNKPATLTMKGLGFIKTPKILVNGKEDKSVVSNIRYKDGVLSFDVTHFSTFTVAPTVGITEPANNFETNNKSITLKGSVSDPNASVSAKLNNKDLGKVKLASGSGDFKTDINLEEGLNNIVITALSASGAKSIATVSGRLLAAVNTNVGLYLLLFILAMLAGFGIIYAMKYMKKRSVKAAQKPLPINPPINL